MAKLDSLSGLAYLKELERSSRDTIMVYNNTDEDFPVVWEGMTEWVIPNKNKDKGHGNGKLPVPRYIALKYGREMAVHQINEYGKVVVEDYKKKYTGSPTEWPKIEENLAPRTNNPELLKKYMKPLILGLVKEYGFEVGTPVPETKSPSGKPVTDDIFEELMDVGLLAPNETQKPHEVNNEVNTRAKNFTKSISE